MLNSEYNQDAFYRWPAARNATTPYRSWFLAARLAATATVGIPALGAKSRSRLPLVGMLGPTTSYCVWSGSVGHLVRAAGLDDRNKQFYSLFVLGLNSPAKDQIQIGPVTTSPVAGQLFILHIDCELYRHWM